MDAWLAMVICIPISIICCVIFWKQKCQRIPSLRGKHIVITGGSRGIGLAIAMEVLEEGGYVTLISNSSSQIDDAISDIAQQGKYSLDEVCTMVADVGDYESISTAIKECYEWRPFDVVICNAGIARIGYMDEINITDVDLVIRTNISGVVYTVHSSLPLMKQRSSKSNPASIVLMGSLASMHPSYGFAIYTATKHALKGLAECLRFELLPFNIRVTLCCPGFAKTPLVSECQSIIIERTPLLPEAQRRNWQNLESIPAIMRVMDFYNPDKLEDPKDIARATVQGIKKGSFLVVTSPGGLLVTTFSRGLFPAESIWTTIIEIIIFASLKLTMVTYLFKAFVCKTIRQQRCRTTP